MNSQVEDVVDIRPIEDVGAALLADLRARRSARPDLDDITNPKAHSAEWQFQQMLQSLIAGLDQPLTVIRDKVSRITELNEIPLLMADPQTKRLLRWLVNEGVLPSWSARTEFNVAQLIERQVATFDEQRIKACEELRTAVRNAERFLNSLSE